MDDMGCNLFLTTVGALIIILSISLLLGLIPANIASKKGYSFVGFWLFGAAFFVVALIVSLALRDKRFDAFQELFYYERLLQAGVITPMEFERRRFELLGHSSDPRFPSQ